MVRRVARNKPPAGKALDNKVLAEDRIAQRELAKRQFEKDLAVISQLVSYSLYNRLFSMRVAGLIWLAWVPFVNRFFYKSIANMADRDNVLMFKHFLKDHTLPRHLKAAESVPEVSSIGYYLAQMHPMAVEALQSHYHQKLPMPFINLIQYVMPTMHKQAKKIVHLGSALPRLAKGASSLYDEIKPTMFTDPQWRAKLEVICSTKLVSQFEGLLNTLLTQKYLDARASEGLTSAISLSDRKHISAKAHTTASQLELFLKFMAFNRVGSYSYYFKLYHYAAMAIAYLLVIALVGYVIPRFIASRLAIRLGVHGSAGTNISPKRKSTIELVSKTASIVEIINFLCLCYGVALFLTRARENLLVNWLDTTIHYLDLLQPAALVFYVHFGRMAYQFVKKIQQRFFQEHFINQQVARFSKIQEPLKTSGDWICQSLKPNLTVLNPLPFSGLQLKPPKGLSQKLRRRYLAAIKRVLGQYNIEVLAHLREGCIVIPADADLSKIDEIVDKVDARIQQLKALDEARKKLVDQLNNLHIRDVTTLSKEQCHRQDDELGNATYTYPLGFSKGATLLVKGLHGVLVEKLQTALPKAEVIFQRKKDGGKASIFITTAHAIESAQYDKLKQALKANGLQCEAREPAAAAAAPSEAAPSEEGVASAAVSSEDDSSVTTEATKTKKTDSSRHTAIRRRREARPEPEPAAPVSSYPKQKLVINFGQGYIYDENNPKCNIKSCWGGSYIPNNRYFIVWKAKESDFADYSTYKKYKIACERAHFVSPTGAQGICGADVFQARDPYNRRDTTLYATPFKVKLLGANGTGDPRVLCRKVASVKVDGIIRHLLVADVVYTPAH